MISCRKNAYSDFILNQPSKKTKKLKKPQPTLKSDGSCRKSGKSAKVRISKRDSFYCPFRRSRRTYHNYVATYMPHYAFDNLPPSKSSNDYDWAEVNRLQNIRNEWIEKYATLTKLIGDENAGRNANKKYSRFQNSNIKYYNRNTLSLRDAETAFFMSHQM